MSNLPRNFYLVLQIHTKLEFQPTILDFIYDASRYNEKLSIPRTPAVLSIDWTAEHHRRAGCLPSVHRTRAAPA